MNNQQSGSQPGQQTPKSPAPQGAQKDMKKDKDLDIGKKDRKDETEAEDKDADTEE